MRYPVVAKHLESAAAELARMSDTDLIALVEGDAFARLLRAIGPRHIRPKESIYQYLLETRTRGTLIADLRSSLTRDFSIQVPFNGRPGFISHAPIQWYDDGVMFTQGSDPFEGIIGLFRDGTIRFGVAAREIAAGEQIGKDDLLFLDPQTATETARQAEGSAWRTSIGGAVTALGALLDRREEAERVYQEFLQAHPWVFGGQYSQVDRHMVLDDRRIPDFTGVRAVDGARDVLEIKQPFLNLFRQDGGFSAEFHQAYDQAERYLGFVQTEHEYLRRQKNLLFENPRCFLVIGHGLSAPQLMAFRQKDRLSTVRIMTYDDLLALAGNMASLYSQYA